MATHDAATDRLVVVLAGAESTGKSALAVALAERLGAPRVEEVARGYFASRPGPESPPRYDSGDLLRIARLQHEAEQRVLHSSAPLVIADTDLAVIRVWWERRFGTPDPWIDDTLRAVQRTGHRRYLVPRPDLPWQPDPLRENPHDRESLHRRYIELLRELGAPFVEVTGTGTDRFERALEAVRSWLSERAS